MGQLNFLQSSSPTKKTKKPKEWTLFVDGASRGNPGAAGAGVYLTSEGKAVLEQGFYLGKKTNNQAEYLALLIGLFFAKKYLGPKDILHIRSDSQLLVRQMMGIYKVKDAQLKVMRDVGLLFVEKIASYTIEHILRGKNGDADRMANHGVDKKVEIPKSCLNILKKHEVF
jgi:ribonuclease HI